MITWLDLDERGAAVGAVAREDRARGRPALMDPGDGVGSACEPIALVVTAAPSMRAGPPRRLP